MITAIIRIKSGSSGEAGLNAFCQQKLLYYSKCGGKDYITPDRPVMVEKAHFAFLIEDNHFVFFCCFQEGIFVYV